MRKVAAIFLALMTALWLPAAAQRKYSPDLAVGGKAGATLSMMSFSPKVTQGLLPGFMAGVTMRYTEEKLFGLIVELNLEQRGWSEKYDPGYDFHYTRTLTYLQLPLLTHIRFGSDRVKAFVNIGPEIGFLLGSSVNANFDWKNLSAVPGYPGGYRTSQQLAMEISNRFDYGISAGIGMELILRKRHSLMLEGRYYYGLGNIFPASKKDYFSASRGMSIEITAAYLFRIR